jgi:hypothetical protein
MNRKIAWIGVVWMAVGLGLAYRGMTLLKTAIDAPEQAPFLRLLMGLGGFEAGVLLLVALSLIVGLVKGRFVLRKAAARLVGQAQLGPQQFRKALLTRSLPLVLLMMGLGMALRFLGTPPDIRGVIDLAVGSALAQGGVAFVRMVGAATQRG